MRQATAETWESVDLLLLPTSPTTATVAAMQADPIRLNSQFGRYTNFANLFGLAAIAIPAGFGPSGLPGGVTLVGPAFTDDALVPFAARMHALAASGLGRDTSAAVPPPPAPHVPEGWITVAVVGAHLAGMPLNGQLTGPGGVFVGEATTAPGYRLYALANTTPAKPGLAFDPQGSGAESGIALELWALPPAAFGAFVAAIPAPLTIGKIALADGRSVSGFLAEAHALAGATEITHFGGWRAYLAAAS